MRSAADVPGTPKVTVRVVFHGPLKAAYSKDVWESEFSEDKTLREVLNVFRSETGIDVRQLNAIVLAIGGRSIDPGSTGTLSTFYRTDILGTEVVMIDIYPAMIGG